MKFARLFPVLLLIAASQLATSAQPAARGAYSMGAPYAVPGGVQPRGAVFVVTTTDDENDKTGGNTHEEVCDPGLGDGLSLREALQSCPSVAPEATVYVPAGSYVIMDDLDSGFDHVVIIGEDPLTTVVDNDHAFRDAGRVFSFVLDGGSAVVANFTLHGSNAIASQTNKNGASVLARGNGDLQLYNIVFSDNLGQAGGAVSVEPCPPANVLCTAGAGAFTVTGVNLTFRGNTAATGSGGALFFDGADTADDTLSLRDSVFLGNTAVNGGALFLGGVESVSLVDVSVSLNSASGQGGGVHFGDSTAVLERSVVEDNSAPLGPDCYVNIGSDPVTSTGGTFIGDSAGCLLLPDATDFVDNLLTNGGFEVAYDDGTRAELPKRPAAWTIKQNRAVRKCNTADKAPAAASGNCWLLLKGGVVKHAVDLTGLSFPAGSELRLSVLVKGSTPGATVSMSAISKSLHDTAKALIQYVDESADSSWEHQAAAEPLESSEITSLKVKIKAGGVGKVSIDRVYLTVLCISCLRGTGMPPPVAPADFRTGN